MRKDRAGYQAMKAWSTAAAVALVLISACPISARAAPVSPEIMTSVVSLLPEWPGFERGGTGAGGPTREPEGTAVAVLPGGYMATNVHVLGRAEKIRIRLEDGRILPAEIVGRDPMTDLALIKAPIDFPVPAVAPPPGLGTDVCAIGNQFGMGLSVTCGVVSAVRRTGTGFNPIEDFIQTDAVVNPGGSGGALIDGKGRLVGIVSAIFTKDSDANIGINFAASMELVMRVVHDLKDHGRVVRGEPGFGVRDLSADEREIRTGAAIERLTRDGPALAAGLRVGDVIVAIDGRPIRRASDVASAVHMRHPGETVAVEVLRDGERRRISLTLAP